MYGKNGQIIKREADNKDTFFLNLKFYEEKLYGLKYLKRQGM